MATTPERFLLRFGEVDVLYEEVISIAYETTGKGYFADIFDVLRVAEYNKANFINRTSSSNVDIY